MKQNKKKWGPVAALAVLLIVIAVCFGLYQAARPQAAQGAKTVTIEVVHGDGSAREFTLQTDGAYLSDALLEGGVVEDNQGPYGLYILTADGETADKGAQEWWCITKGGAEVMYSASEQPIADGEHYELTLTVGYES